MESMFNFLDPYLDNPDEVSQMRKMALALWRQGTKVMNWQGEGVNAGRQFTAPTEVILRETRYFLKMANPRLNGRIIRQSNYLRVR